ncbi:MAG: hypothetical protein ABI548_25065 [Polyangiaceae bacterium]
MRPTSSRCSARIGFALALALAVALGGGCARTPQFASSAALPNRNERRAPGVTESRNFTVPDPVRQGNSEDQLLLLRAPAGTALARDTVRDFLRAAVNEAPARLELLLAPDAFVDTGAGRQPARAFWQTRIAQLDYTELRGQLLFRDGDVETFRAEDLTRLPAGRRIPLELRADEVAVRVPIRVSWAGRTRLFGDELLFRLQPAGVRFEIAEISEDFRLP